MTKEEINALDMSQLEERAQAISEEVETAEEGALEALSEELDTIEERKSVIIAEAEEKRAAMDAVIEGQGEEVEKVEEREIMTNIEVRKSPEYLNAWVENIKGTANEEQRALLTENVEGGTIKVPVYVEDRIETAWENNEILQRVKKSYFKGIVKVGVEISASGAVIHTEGGDPISPEELVVAYTELIPMTYKKMVEVSDEVLDSNEAFIDYLVDEITYQLAKAVANGVVAMIVANVDVTEYEAAGATLTTADIINAEGDLVGDSNPVVITTRSAAAALKAAALSAGYGYDPFDGMEVLYTDAAAITGALAIVADLSGVQANFPNGFEPRIKVDETTSMAADMVRVLGRLPAGIGVINYGKIVKIVAGS